MTQEQRDIIRHSLGLDYEKTPFRNRYLVSDGNPALEAMVEAGWMSRGATTEAATGVLYRYYHVTEAGAAAIDAELPKD